MQAANEVTTTEETACRGNCVDGIVLKVETGSGPVLGSSPNNRRAAGCCCSSPEPGLVLSALSSTTDGNPHADHHQFG